MKHTRRFPISMSVTLVVAAALLPACTVEETPAPEARSKETVAEIPAELAARIASIHETTVFADMHGHPSRFHRADVERIASEELELYLRGHMDIATANISTDAAYSGGYFRRDGTEAPRDQYKPAPGEAFALTLDRFQRLEATVASGEAVWALDAETVLGARANGQVAILGALEGGDGLEGSLDNLRTLYDRGLRLLQIVHFRANEFGHIQTYPYSPGGLTDFGRQAIEEANRLGIVIDLAHANTQTIRDVLEVSEDPVIFSHGGLKAVQQQDRALTDEEVAWIATAGGVVGIWPNGASVATVADMVDLMEHVIRVGGIDHVGIGSDLRGMSSYSSGFGEEANFRAIAAELLQRGHSDEDVGKIMGGNFFRVFEEVTGR
jgi:membrane dipeptidase